MPTGASAELDAVRREYEGSLSWRVTRPLRALGRAARRLRHERPAVPPAPGGYDSWLTALHGDELAAIDAACASGGPERWALFHELDADLWAVLLTQEYEAYPHIRALLPDMPDPRLQQRWTGASGAALAAQSVAFYRRLCERFSEHGPVSLADATVLDFGCGWGRLTRMLARDVPYERLFGCDPSEAILDVCRRNGVPAQLTRSAFLPERIPFDETFDLAFAFSVFTHLSESAHECCLRALHAALRPGGILVVTVRPPAYLDVSELMEPLREPLDPARARYLFVAHPADPSHPQYEGGDMTYGETVVTLAYVRERWSEMFALLEADILLADPFQVMLTLRRV
jgi:SAM-dependent methyltransferase